MDVELKKPFEVTFKILKFYGLWMDGGETLFYKIRGISTILICSILFWILLFAEILKKEESLEIAYSITFFVPCTIYIVRIIDFIEKIQSMKMFYESFEEVKSKLVINDHFIRKRLKFCFKAFSACFGGVIISATALCIVSFSTHHISYPIAVPFNMKNTEIGFYVVNFYMTVTLSFVAPVYVAFGWCPMFFMNFVIGFMEDFNEKLQIFGEIDLGIKNEKEKNEIIMKQLIEIIQIHEKIKSFVKELSRIFKLTFFLNGVAGSLILCTALFVIPVVSSCLCYVQQILFQLLKTIYSTFK